MYGKDLKLLTPNGKAVPIYQLNQNESLINGNVVQQAGKTMSRILYKLKIPELKDEIIVTPDTILRIVFKGVRTPIQWTESGWNVSWSLFGEIFNQFFPVTALGEKQQQYRQAVQLFSEMKSNPGYIERGYIYNITVNEYVQRSQDWKGYWAIELVNIKTSLDTTLDDSKISYQLSNRNIYLDPFVLGYWLGDKASNASIVHLYKNIDKSGVDICQSFTTTKKTGSMLIISNPEFRKFLRRFRLTNTKYIPLPYKYGAEHIRQRLLEGMLVTGSRLDDSTGQYDITVLNEELKDDVIYLIRSLGHWVENVRQDFGKGYQISFYYRLPEMVNTVDFQIIKLVEQSERKAAAMVYQIITTNSTIITQKLCKLRDSTGYNNVEIVQQLERLFIKYGCQLSPPEKWYRSLLLNYTCQCGKECQRTLDQFLDLIRQFGNSCICQTNHLDIINKMMMKLLPLSQCIEMTDQHSVYEWNNIPVKIEIISQVGCSIENIHYLGISRSVFDNVNEIVMTFVQKLQKYGKTHQIIEMYC